MPATEGSYRRQPMLNAVFAITSIVMLLTIVWMIMADHLRPWKVVQREFQHIETEKLEAQRQEKLAQQKAEHQADLEKVDAEIKAAKELEARNAREIRDLNAKLKAVKGRWSKVDTARRFQKAELDSQRSFYDGMIDLDEYEQARAYMLQTIAPSERRLEELSIRYEEAEKELKSLEAQIADLRGNVDDKIKKRDALTRQVDIVQRALEQKERQYYGPLAWLRGLPIIDLAAPPTKIQQISLPDLTINYNFKNVPRYDRCTTCHLGIDRIGYDVMADGKSKMPAVFHSHPHLTDGATAIDPKGNVVPAGLYLDANGPHPINSFGCTICHGGQGSGTDFTFSSHTPDTLKQREEWEKEHNWHEIHHWDEPMLPARFLESSCLKCHHQVTDIPQAKKLQAGYERITKYGCTGCHTIGGEGSFGPDLTDNRPVGPNLAHIASKTSKDWTLKWIRNPHAFRPDTRMPRFYDVTNNSSKEDQPKVEAEVHAITHYLFAVSTPPKGFSDAPKGNAETGKSLFFSKGCMACHSHRPYKADDLPVALREKFAGSTDPAQTFDVSTFPEGARKTADKYANANFGPNLVNIADKFQSAEQGRKWLANWIKSPESYHPKSLMPNLQLTRQEAADIAEWIISVPASWPVRVEVPKVDSPEVRKGLDELTTLFIGKSKNYKGKTVLLADLDAFVKNLPTDEKLMYVGERTISRLGCFGCHNIPGFEDAKPIGTPLNDWGVKSPTKLDFGHIIEYLNDHKTIDEKGEPDYDGTDELYAEKLAEHTRTGFLFQKLHRPRSYDYKKTKEELKAWDDRLRMPQFTFADDPKAVEEVMTFVLGLTGERVHSRYLPNYTPQKTALAQGERLLNRYNCRGCHVTSMPRFVLTAGTKVTDALPSFQTNVEVAYGDRAKDYRVFSPDLRYDPNVTTIKLAEDIPAGETVDPKTTLVIPKDDGKQSAVIEGMPIGVTNDEDDQGKPIVRIAVQLWRPVTIRGFTFQTGDNVTVDPAKVGQIDADGGDFAWLYATAESERTGNNITSFWNRLPPPLLREGLKVQTPWLTAFLKDPYPIRPAVQLRMPRFHYGTTPETIPAKAGKPPTDAEREARVKKVHAELGAETRDLANYFAAVDGAEFPYQDIPERERSYLSEWDAKHPNYLAGGWQLVTKGLCIQCHAIGQYKPTGGADVVNGPDLRQVSGRFRPGYLFEWLGQPARLVPYTAMPQNVPPNPPPGAPTTANVPKSFDGKPLDQVRAMRDMLLNYVTTVESQLASPTPAPGAPKPDAAGEKTGGGR